MTFTNIENSDIGNSTDLPISENQNDLLISAWSVIRISYIGKSGDFLISVNQNDVSISEIEITILEN